MVFIGGPRQVGKTTFSFSFLEGEQNEKHPAYFNWDHAVHAKRIRNMEFPLGQKLLILDEVHKYARWRNLVKGIYDTEKSIRSIIVTGSARLDYYRKSGDSLLGRYQYFRLHPFSILEMTAKPEPRDLESLLRFGGFPEPLMKQSEKILRIWQRDRMTRVIREDLRDLERVREITLIERLAELLPQKIGSPLSVNSLREDLQVDHKTVERWIIILENLYVCFRILPYGPPKVRAVKKENKLYLWDWSEIKDPGARFENLVACQLLKYCHYLEDSEGYKMELRFLRDTDKREIDFVVIKDGTALFAVECKTGEKSIGNSLRYFADRTAIPHFYQIHRGEKSFSQNKITVLPFIEFCQKLSLP
ncbi:MAG: ATP-binding protein [Deltaproteobacteria bacterium]|nr:ATP-binding protein [Deltaproteobacteria bacterium]